MLSRKSVGLCENDYTFVKRTNQVKLPEPKVSEYVLFVDIEKVVDKSDKTIWNGGLFWSIIYALC